MNATEEEGRALRVVGARVTDQIRKAILSGQLEAGGRLRQEELAERFKASRIPIREALRKLEGEGLVSLVPNSGAWVSPFDLKDCIEAYKIRETIEPLAIRESVRTLSDADVRKLADLADAMDIVESTADFLSVDEQFHLLSYSSARMPQLLSMVHRFWNSTKRYRHAFVHALGPAARKTTQYEHRLITDAVMRRDGKGAGEVLHHHIRGTRIRLQQRPDLFPAR